MNYLYITIAWLTAIASLRTEAGTSYTIENNDRIVYVIGQITESSISLAHRIERLSARSKEPIHVVINSPGGSVLAGYQIIQAMDIARNRNVEVVCAVGTMAASMAFQLLPHCDQRYALKKSLLLFHPARVFIQGALTADDAASIADDLNRIAKQGDYEVKEMMGVPSDEWYSFHNKNETMWTAESLAEETTKRWLEVVDEITTPEGIFNVEVKSATSNNKIDFNVFPWLKPLTNHEKE